MNAFIQSAKKMLSALIASSLLAAIAMPVGFARFLSFSGDLSISEETDLAFGAAESDATLSSLEVLVIEGTQSVTLEPPHFDSEWTKYTATVEIDVTRIEIRAEATGESARVVGDVGIQDFPYGASRRTYEVVVSAEDGTRKTYAIEVVKRLGSVELQSLTASNTSLDKKSQTVYVATVPGSETSTVISAMPVDVSSALSGDIGLQALEYGPNEFRITVTNAVGNMQIYTVLINRLMDETRLSYLSVEDAALSPDFDPEVAKYRTTVPNEIKSTVLFASAMDPDAQVSGDLGVMPLVEGLNVFTVIVMAQDGMRRIYRVEITREAPQTTGTRPPEEGDDSGWDINDAWNAIQPLTPLVEGVDRIALLVHPGAQVVLSHNGVTVETTADEYGYALFEIDALEADRSLSFRVKESDGQVTTKVMTSHAQMGRVTLARAYPAAGLKLCFDAEGKCRAMPLIGLKAAWFDENGLLTLPLLVGGVYEIGTVTLRRDESGALQVSYALAEAYAAAEVVSEALEIYPESPSDAMLLIEGENAIRESNAVSWDKPVWMKLDLSLKLDASELPGNAIDFDAVPPDPRAEWIGLFQKELHG